MASERLDEIKTRLIQDLRDILQRDIKLLIEKDLLQPEQLGLAIVSIACIGTLRWLQQVQLVVYVKCAHTYARKPGQLPDGISGSPHASIVFTKLGYHLR